jgi:integrase
LPISCRLDGASDGPGNEARRWYSHEESERSAQSRRHGAARAAWQRARLAPIGLHECRHTYAAFMIAAGVNAKALSTYMGHSSITVTLDRYGHLMPGNGREAAVMVASYLRRETLGLDRASSRV